MCKKDSPIEPVLSPLNEEEANAIIKAFDGFYKRQAKKYGPERMEFYMSSVIGVMHPSGVLTNVRGNLQISQFSMSVLLEEMVSNVSKTLKLSREVVLLSSISTMAKEVRKLWASPPKSFSPN